MINLFNNYGELNFDFEKIIDDVWAGVKKLHNLNDEIDLSLILVDAKEIHRINLEYRHKDYVTDVISFEEHEEENYLGDIFICIEKVFEQARTYEHSVKREFAFLLCHGILHLLGYDHLTFEEEKEMFSIQDELLEYINYPKSIV